MKNHSLLTTVLMILVLNINASELTIPNTFVANTPAVAAQVNANFAAVEVSVDDNDSRLDALEALVTQLQTDLATANSTISVLQANTVLQLDGFLQLAVVDGYDTAEFSGINVQVNDGSDDTDGVVNGLGNLIVGYGEDSPSARFFCSYPQYSDSTSCTDNSGVWDNNVRTGSHNLVVGFGHSYTQYGSIVLSESNVSNAYGTFVAGWGNLASGLYSSVIGGQGNNAIGSSSSVSGGLGNTAAGVFSSVSGGFNNRASGAVSSISGGQFNDAFGSSSSVTGGQNNNANEDYSSVSGGQNNDANGDYSSVSGGGDNTASEDYSSVSGGRDNNANGLYSSVSSGRDNDAIGNYSSVSGARNSNAIGNDSSVSGGRDNDAFGNSSSVTGGRNNDANGDYSTVSGGLNRTAAGINDWVAGSLFENN